MMKTKNFAKRIISIAMSLTMVCTLAVTAFASNEGMDIDYKIDNPYAEVDFENDTAYKADLHSHTTFSDGDFSFEEMVEKHYELGFDIYARTDHSTTSYGYMEHKYVPAMKALGFFTSLTEGENRMAGEVFSENGSTSTGNTYKVTTSDAGDEYYTQVIDGKDKQAMLSVPFGNEQNGTSLNNAHVNTWFVDYGNGRLGGTSDYESVIKDVHELGGLSVINHPGEYTNARDEVYTEDAYDMDNFIYKYKITKFEELLLKYDSCLGIDINSKGDSRTRFDRKLWDIMLQDLVPHGRNVFAIATSDAHKIDIVDSGYTMHYMESNTSANLKENMINGGFFAASKNVGNYDEMIYLRDTLKELYLSDTSEASEEIKVQAQEMHDKLAILIEKSVERMEEGDSNYEYDAPRGSESPLFTNVVVDETEDTIALTVENALIVRWIADGKVIHVGDTIDLDDYSDEIGSYVRAEAYGAGGVMYTQAFALEYDGAPEAEERGFFYDLGGITSGIVDTVVKFFIEKILPIEAFVNLPLEKILGIFKIS